MEKRKLVVNISLVVLAMGAIVAFGVLTGTEQVQAGSVCEGDVKVEGSGAVTYIAPPDDSWASVCIKAGRDAISVSCGVDLDDGCYTVDWTEGADGCCVAVTIAGGGTGRDCKAISHTAATLAGGGPCAPDPSPSPDPSPDPSPSPSPSP